MPNVLQESNLSRLAPSVYSHPTVTDPLLKSPKSFYQDPSVLIPKKGFNVSSSGAYFDTSAVSKESELQAQNDIIAQLTREMRLNNGGGHLSGGSDVESSGSTSTLNNPAATAERIAALAFQAKHNVSSSNIPVPISAKPSKSTSESQSKPGKSLPPPQYSSPVRGTDLNLSKESVKSRLAEPRKMSVPSTSLSVNAGKPDNLPLLSCSQPDLTSLLPSQSKPGTSTPATLLNSPETVPGPLSQENYDIVCSENRDLKVEVETMRRKIHRLDNLEKEMMKIHEAYQALREHSEKRELLEKSARTKLQAEILNHQEINKEIRERHEAVMAQIMSGDTSNIPGLDSILRGEILRKDALITQLANQNKELMSAKERQDIECAEQRETLQEQRTHIDVLDTALSNAQNNVLRLEEELRQKEAYAERVKQMTKSLEQLQAASEKREAMEKKLRAKLEDELKELRTAAEAAEGREGREGEEDSDSLIRKLSEYEEKIIRMESERTQWEQRYLEESAMRQVAIDAASIPKDAKIAVLEKTSAESEKKIAEARSEKLKQMAEVQQYQRKMVDMELKVKALETNLAERNAMIKVLQKRAFEKPTDIENILSIPIHDPVSLNLHAKQLSTSHLGSPLSQLAAASHASQHSTPIPFSAGAPFSAPTHQQLINHAAQLSMPTPYSVASHHASIPPYASSHASQHSTPISFSSHTPQQSTPIPFSSQEAEGHHGSPLYSSLSHGSTPIPFPISHLSQHSTPVHFNLASHAPSQLVSHASQHSTPLPTSPRHAASDFYEGISSSMSSTARGPLGRMTARVRSGSPAAHLQQRSATPSDLLRSGTPTREMKQMRRDSAPPEVYSLMSESPGKTLISTSELYNAGGSVKTGGTLPKMSFGMVKEENSRTLPSKNYSSLAESLRESYPEGIKFTDQSSSLAEALLEEERFIERPVGTGGTKKGERTVEKQGRGDRKAERSMDRTGGRADMSIERSIDRTGGRADRSMERMVKERPGKGERGGTVERLLESGNGGGGAVELPKNKKGGPNNGQSYPSMSPEKRSDNGDAVSLDESVNSSMLDKDSLLLALKEEKEKRPENFWRV